MVSVIVDCIRLFMKLTNYFNMALRLTRVSGLQEQTNDLIYSPPLYRTCDKTTVVFFPGDVQNYPEIMESDPENSLFVKWNLIDVAGMLRNHFKTSNILVIKPSRVENDIYSCYDNFIYCDRYGTPDLKKFSKAVSHLECLLDNASVKVNEEFTSVHYDSQWKASETNFIIIGFSKGCVVLNQLVYELCQGNIGQYLSRKISSLRWLDGGHGGKEQAWITQPDVLSNLAKFPYQIHVEVTPYQIKRRSWVGREERIFTETLNRLGANVHCRLHFASSEPSLMDHFKLLDELFSTN